MIRGHVQARADVAIDLGEPLLPLFGQQPIDINLGSVLVWRSIEKPQAARTRADVGAFLDLSWIQNRDG